MEEVVKEPMEVPAWQTDEDAVKVPQAVIDRKIRKGIKERAGKD